MPAVSKQQRKFMGLVHAVQKGEVPASKVSKSARDAAKQIKKKDVEDFASTDEKGLPKKVKKEERDYKDEYKKFQSSTKAKKYRAELNQYNRKKGTYGNGDGKDASHKGGKIAGFEKESTNRGRAEKSRLKKEDVMPDFESFIDEVIDEIFEEHTINEGKNQMKQVYVDLDKKFKKYDYTKITDFNKVDKYLKTKFSKDSSLPDTIASFYHDYRGGEDMNKNIARLVKYAKKMKGYKKEGLREALLRENPAAAAAAAMAAIQVQNAQGKKIKGTSALQSSDPRVQKKAKGIFKRLKDKFAKSKGKRDFEKQKKSVAKGAADYLAKLDKKESVLEKFVDESGILYKAGVKKYGKEGMKKIQQAAGKRKSHAEIGKIKDKYEKGKKAEGSCGYGIDGKVGDEPAGPHLIKKKKIKEAVVNNLKQAMSYIHTDTKDGAEFMKLMKLKSYNKKQAIRAFTLGMRGDAVHGAGPGGMSQFARHVTKHLKESVNEGFTKYHIRLTDTPGWYGVWDKNGKQKFEGDKRLS